LFDFFGCDVPLVVVKHTLQPIEVLLADFSFVIRGVTRLSGVMSDVEKLNWFNFAVGYTYDPLVRAEAD